MCLHSQFVIERQGYILSNVKEFILREGKRVSNVLYTLCNKSLESNVMSHLAHETKPRR